LDAGTLDKPDVMDVNIESAQMDVDLESDMESEDDEDKASESVCDTDDQSSIYTTDLDETDGEEVAENRDVYGEEQTLGFDAY
jgi:hypothetical protein